MEQLMNNLNAMDLVLLLGGMFALAATAGFLAGLLGIGGGLVIVPGLYFVFTSLGYDSPNMMHLAVGTSLCTILGTGLSSARAHHRRGNVDFALVKKIGVGMVIGVLIGTLIADAVSGLWLKIFFAVTLIILAIIMRINPEKFSIADQLPPQPLPTIAGSGIGIICTLMGIGGAALNVPYMTLHKVAIHKAIGTAATLGLLIAIPGAIGFLVIGWGDVQGMPPLSFGYVNVLALAVIMPVTVLFAPIGVYVGQLLSVSKMRQVFSIFMIIIAIRMIYEVLRAF